MEIKIIPSVLDILNGAVMLVRHHWTAGISTLGCRHLLSMIRNLVQDQFELQTQGF